MSAAQHRRLRTLEVARESSGSTPAYICVQSVEEIPAALGTTGDVKTLAGVLVWAYNGCNHSILNNRPNHDRRDTSQDPKVSE